MIAIEERVCYIFCNIFVLLSFLFIIIITAAITSLIIFTNATIANVTNTVLLFWPWLRILFLSYNVLVIFSVYYYYYHQHNDYYNCYYYYYYHYYNHYLYFNHCWSRYYSSSFYSYYNYYFRYYYVNLLYCGIFMFHDHMKWQCNYFSYWYYLCISLWSHFDIICQ